MAEPLRVSLDLESPTPAYRQIANDLRRHLVEERLKPGDLLPLIRQLAVDLGVHFNTVALAYRMLADEGWLELKRRRGAAVIARNAPRAVDRRRVDHLLRQLSHIAAELRSAGQTTRLVRDGGAAMSALGHAPQLDPSDDVVNLFYLDDNGRRPIKRDGDRFVIGGDTVRPQADLIAEAGSHPERFSPCVVMRPLVQDRLLPTACYVAGPAELAYQAQIGGVYEAFGMEAPLLQSRASITVLDSGCSRFLERHSLPFEALQPNDESTLNRLLEQQLPPSVDRLLQESLQYFTSQTNALRDAVAGIDPTLTGTVDTTASKIADTLKTLQNKIVQACKRKDETLRRQFVRARSLTFPGGAPQERVLNVAFFANRYGLDIGARLIDILPTDTSKHYLVQL